MILDEKKTTVAYRCPGCGAMVRSMIGAFTLSADMMRLKCPCGESDITIVYTPDKKLRLNVPCFFCPKPHQFPREPEYVFRAGAFYAAVRVFRT